MTGRLFFKYCKELVAIRWVVWYSNADEIQLTPLPEYWQNSSEFTRPLCAVAIDVFGPRGEYWFDPGVAASRLELSSEVARLIHTASKSPFYLTPLEEEVRGELVSAFEAGKRFDIIQRRRR